MGEKIKLRKSHSLVGKMAKPYHLVTAVHCCVSHLSKMAENNPNNFSPKSVVANLWHACHIRLSNTVSNTESSKRFIITVLNRIFKACYFLTMLVSFAIKLAILFFFFTLSWGDLSTILAFSSCIS